MQSTAVQMMTKARYRDASEVKSSLQLVNNLYKYFTQLTEELPIKYFIMKWMDC